MIHALKRVTRTLGNGTKRRDDRTMGSTKQVTKTMMLYVS